MRPKTIKADLPTTYNVMSHLHNEFVGWLQQLKADIEVLESIPSNIGSLTLYKSQAAPGLILTTADGWSVDMTKASFLSVTAHWIEVKNGKWKLQAEVVGFRGISGEHSGANLGQAIRKTTHTFFGLFGSFERPKRPKSQKTSGLFNAQSVY
jgi:hypothetical protein